MAFRQRNMMLLTVLHIYFMRQGRIKQCPNEKIPRLLHTPGFRILERTVGYNMQPGFQLWFKPVFRL